MKSIFWLGVLAFVVAAAWLIARIRRTMQERKRAEEERAASFLAGMAGSAGPGVAAPIAAPPAAAAAAPAAAPSANPVARAEVPRARPVDDLAQQKLLFESAHKAGEAGEPALAIQLYARLLVRYPASAFAEQARAGAEAQKKKLVKA